MNTPSPQGKRFRRVRDRRKDEDVGLPVEFRQLVFSPPSMQTHPLAKIKRRDQFLAFSPLRPLADDVEFNRKIADKPQGADDVTHALGADKAPDKKQFDRPSRADRSIGAGRTSRPFSLMISNRRNGISASCSRT